MKQPVRLYFCLTGLALLLSTSLRAQSDSTPKSRLEMGRKPTPVEQRDLQTKKFPFLKQASATSLYRGTTVRRNSAINEYFRTQLIASPVTKSAAKSTSIEGTN